MSKSSELDQTVKAYLINAMDFEGYDEMVGNPETTQEKIEACHKVFTEEVGKYIIDNVGPQTAIKEWLQGLPTIMKIPVYRDEIVELSVEMGSIPENHTEKQADKMNDNYYQFMAAKLLQLFQGYRVPKD